MLKDGFLNFFENLKHISHNYFSFHNYCLTMSYHFVFAKPNLFFIYTLVV